MINAIQTALSGLAASTKRVEASAANIANLGTSGSLEDSANPPFSAVTTIQQTQTDGNGNPLGVTSGIVPKDTAFVPSYDPDSPFANKSGLVGLPNVNIAEEAVNLIIAEIAYKANLSVIETATDLSEEVLNIIDTKA